MNREEAARPREETGMVGVASSPLALRLVVAIPHLGCVVSWGECYGGRIEAEKSGLYT